MANSDNLKPFPKGISGNPSGRPKGSLNMATRIRDYLESPQKLTYKAQEWNGEPAELLVRVYTEKALSGDIRAFDLLVKYGYGTKIDIENDGKEPRIYLVNRGGESTYESLSDLSDEELETETDKNMEKYLAMKKQHVSVVA